MNELDPAEEVIFNAARQLGDAAKVAQYLDLACEGQPELRARILRLLQASAEADLFFDRHATFAADVLSPAFKSVPLPPSEPLVEQVGQCIGRYKLLEKIGEGGMGIVYMAEQEEPVRRKVALKVIKLGMDTRQVVARFEAERQALALMDHPHIAKVLDGGATDTGRPFFVMELVQGVPITEFCEQNQLSVQERLKLFIPVSQAIQSAHQKGIIHRDLKPTNILVTLNAGVPHPMVIDFGVAKAINQKLTEKTLFTNYATMIGTPAYMSPEQAEMSRLDVDTRSDIYGLGVLLYELLTGTTPFPEKRLRSAGYQEMQRIIMEEEPERPSTRLRRTKTLNQSSAEISTLHSQLSTDLDWIVMKCLEKDRARRYETANGLAVDLQRHLNNEPVVARPPSQLYRFQKLVRRNTLAVAAGGLVTVALVVGIFASTFEATRAKRAEKQAVSAQERAQTEAKRADHTATEFRETLAVSDFAEANRLIEAGDPADAVAHLSRILTMNPGNHAALSQLAIALTYHSWMVPTLSLKHEDFVNSAEFSLDGKRIVTACRDNAARVWDAQTGSLIAGPLRHEAKVVSAHFSPDGLRLVTASEDHTARVWDARSGLQLTQLLGHEARLETAQFSPDGKLVVTASDDKTARIWDTQTGRPVTEPLSHKDCVLFAEFSPDGKKVVTTSCDTTARVWDARTGQPLTDALPHGHWVLSANFSPDSRRVVTACLDGSARVWDSQTGLPLSPCMPHLDHVWTARFSLDGRKVVTASADRTGRVWDAQTGQPLTPPLWHAERVGSARFSPDGERVVTVAEDHTARVWDAQTGRVLEEMRHGGEVVEAEFSPDGQRLITASYDGTACVWDQPIARALTTFLGRKTRAQFSADGRRVATTYENTAQVWDAQTGRPLTSPMTHKANIFFAEFSPDGNRLATASEDGTARVWDAQTGRPLTPPLRHDSRVYRARFSPDGNRLATACWDKTAMVWDAQTGELLTGPLKHAYHLHDVQFSPDGERLLTASWDGTAQLWDARTGRRVGEPLRHQGEVCCANFSPDGRRIVTASFDRTARIWDAQTGQPLTGPLQHDGSVNSAEFSLDGKCVVTATFNKTARVWDAGTGLPLSPPLKDAANVWYATFSPDSQSIVTTLAPLSTDDWFSPVRFSPDGRRLIAASSGARLWDARTGQPLSELLAFSTESQPDASGKRPELLLQNEAAGLWDVGFVPSKLPPWLLPLAEALAGQRLNKQGILEPTDLDRAKTIAAIRRELHNQPDHEEGVAWGRWLLADPASRTISPFSTLTVSAYVEQLLQAPTKESLEEAAQLVYGNAELRQRISTLSEKLAQIAVLSSNGDFYVQSGQWTNAVEAFSQLVQLDPTYEDHLSRALAGLGNLLRDQGKTQDAESAYRQGLALSRKLHPADFEDRRSLALNLGSLLRQQGRLPEAQALYTETIDARKNANEPGDLAALLAGLGDVLRDQGNMPDAEAVYRQGLDYFHQSHSGAAKLPIDHETLPWLASGLAFSLQRQSNWADAESYYREAITNATNIWPNDPGRWQWEVADLAFVLDQQGKLAEAEPFYWEAVTNAAKLWPREAANWQWQLQGLTNVLQRQGKTAELERLSHELPMPVLPSALGAH